MKARTHLLQDRLVDHRARRDGWYLPGRLATWLVGFVIAFPLATLASSGDLGLTLANLVASLKARAEVSCSGALIDGLSFEFHGASLIWKRPEPLTEITIVVAFQSPRLEGELYLCEISPTETDAIFGFSNQTMAGQSRRDSLCSIRCGGVRPIDKSTAFSVQGTLTASGLYQTASQGGRRFREQVSVPIVLEFSPAAVLSAEPAPNSGVSEHREEFRRL